MRESDSWIWNTDEDPYEAWDIRDYPICKICFARIHYSMAAWHLDWHKGVIHWRSGVEFI